MESGTPLRTGLSRWSWLWVLLITLGGLGLRLLVWRWREFQPLGGDEQEYLNAALALLQERRYQELLFMRPPLYPVLLAAWIYLVDSLVQNLRLVQALVSAATIPLVALLALEVARAVGHPRPARPALVAAGLCALSYTLAANAAELLTETVFLFGLCLALLLILRAGTRGSLFDTAAAGLCLGALCLVRSVALPLLPLSALWLLVNATRSRGWTRRAAAQSCILLVACCIVLLPWTARNYLAYGGLILIDTTGAENLWLDNDPAGREAVKAQLFALGDDRLARQQLGSRNGLAVIAVDPERFVAKAWGELKKFFALEYADDMRARPAIWVRPADVGLRLLLGDGLWLLLLLAGGYGLARNLRLPAGDARSPSPPASPASPARPLALSPAWLLAPWALYVLLTTLIFHVELRYRLPLFPALLPFAALLFAGGVVERSSYRSRLIAATLPALCLVLTLLHANYPALAWQLGWKHAQLALAEAALARGDATAARAAADAALALDERSALARIARARADLLADDPTSAAAQLDAALASLPAHPQARVLRGDRLRATGETEAAAADLAYETATQQDLQRWLWPRATTAPPQRLELGDGLDLGFLRGFHGLAAADAGFRWSTASAEFRLSAPPAARELVLRVASGRPAGAPTVPVELLLDGVSAGTFSVDSTWQELRVPLNGAEGAVVVGLRASTFTPRDFDPASPDGRRLGVQVDWAELR
jgi:hypothetical protein